MGARTLGHVLRECSALGFGARSEGWSAARLGRRRPWPCQCLIRERGVDGAEAGGGASAELEDLPGCSCTPPTFWGRQTLEDFGKGVVKNTFQEKECYTRQEAITGLSRDVTSLNPDGSIGQKQGK